MQKDRAVAHPLSLFCIFIGGGRLCLAHDHLRRIGSAMVRRWCRRRPNAVRSASKWSPRFLRKNASIPWCGVVSARGLRGDGLVRGPTRHQDRVHRAPVHRASVQDSGRPQRRGGRRGVPAVAHLLHSTSCSPSWVRMHHATSPANTVHVHPSVFTSTAEVKSVPLKIKCILQGMQGSKL